MSEDQRIQDYGKTQAVKELTQEDPQRDESASESLQKTDRVKRQLKKTLLGMEEKENFNKEKGEWETKLVKKEGVEPLINRQGLEDLWALIEPIVSETAAGSNLSAGDVSQEGFQAMRDLAKAIAVKNDEYGIEDQEDASLIVQAFNSACKNNLKKAEDGRLLKHHEESTQRKVFRTEGGEQQESGGLSKYNPFK